MFQLSTPELRIGYDFVFTGIMVPVSNGNQNRKVGRNGYSGRKAGSIGSIEKFNPDSHNFETWYDLYEMYCKTNKFNADTRKSVFLQNIGYKVYDAIKAGLPEKPMDYQLDYLVDFVRKHVSSPPDILPERERVRFHSRNQLESENVRNEHPKDNKCHACGSTSHIRAGCRHRYDRCNKCNVVGHMARVCKLRKSNVDISHGNNFDRNGNCLNLNENSSNNVNESNIDQNSNNNDQNIVFYWDYIKNFFYNHGLAALPFLAALLRCFRELVNLNNST